MKEITIRLADPVAEFVSMDAKEMGLTSEELIKYLVGSHAQQEARARQSSMSFGSPGMIGLIGRSLPELLKEADKHMLKMRARNGALSCKNCTMRLTEKDVEAGECSSCHAPLFDEKSRAEE